MFSEAIALLNSSSFIHARVPFGTFCVVCKPIPPGKISINLLNFLRKAQKTPIVKILKVLDNVKMVRVSCILKFGVEPV